MSDSSIRPETPRASSAPQPAPTCAATASHDAIARRAYDIYVETGRAEGRCERNWRQAEEEIERTKATAGAPVVSGTRPSARPGPGPVVAKAPMGPEMSSGGRDADRDDHPPVAERRDNSRG